jgi:hypothetical protein
MSYYKKVTLNSIVSAVILAVLYSIVYRECQSGDEVGGPIILAYIIILFNACILLSASIIIPLWWARKIKLNSLLSIFTTVSLFFLLLGYLIYARKPVNTVYILEIFSLILFMSLVSLIYQEGRGEKNEKSTANQIV